MESALLNHPHGRTVARQFEGCVWDGGACHALRRERMGLRQLVRFVSDRLLQADNFPLQFGE